MTQGEPGLIEEMPNWDHGLTGATFTSRRTRDGDTFTLNQMLTRPSASSTTMIAFTQDGLLRSLSVQGPGPGAKRVQYSLALGHFGQVNIAAPSPAEVTKTQTVSGRCNPN